MLKHYADPYLSSLGVEHLDSVPEKQPKYDSIKCMPTVPNMYVDSFSWPMNGGKIMFSQSFLISAPCSEAHFACSPLGTASHPLIANMLA